MTIVDEIYDLFGRFGSEAYGEALSLEAHMLQSAAHARALHAPPSVIAAALLHDIGYFVRSNEGLAHGDDDTGHEAIGATWLSRGFGEAVTAPIALHVQAKQYLCAVEPGYFGRLSDASRRSLEVQGGVMDAAQAAAFRGRPAFEAAVSLRRCDDLGKDPSTPTPGLEDYRDLLMGCLRKD
jgi:predicted HD phosphohydrolase